MAEKNKYRYYIVEFEDEVHLVPRNWLSDDTTKTYWPNFSSRMAFERAVSNMVSFQENWNEFTVKKIIAVTNNFEKGKRLLELAGKIKEDSSDNEDYQTCKRKRRRKPSKQYSANEGNITPQKTSRKVTLRPSLYSVSKCASDLIDELMETNSSNPRDQTNLPSPNSSRRDADLHELHTIIVRAFSEMTNIGKKIDRIVSAQAEISKKLDFLWRRETRDIVENCDNLLLLNVSSLKVLKALSDVEEKLADSQYRLLLFEEIDRLGIMDVKPIVEYILGYVLANLLDEEYLWLEMEKGPLFIELRLFLIIADVVRFLEPKATALQISNGIKMWLTQIKLIREHTNSNSFTEQDLEKSFIINKDVESQDDNIDGKNQNDDNTKIADKQNQTL